MANEIRYNAVIARPNIPRSLGFPTVCSLRRLSRSRRCTLLDARFTWKERKAQNDEQSKTRLICSPWVGGISRCRRDNRTRAKSKTSAIA